MKSIQQKLQVKDSYMSRWTVIDGSRLRAIAMRRKKVNRPLLGACVSDRLNNTRGEKWQIKMLPFSRAKIFISHRGGSLTWLHTRAWDTVSSSDGADAILVSGEFQLWTCMLGASSASRKQVSFGSVFICAAATVKRMDCCSVDCFSNPLLLGKNYPLTATAA